MTSQYTHRHKLAGKTKCSVCQEIVRGCRQLACDHTFCETCVKKQLDRLTSLLEAREEITIVCPYCREFFHSSVSVNRDGSRTITSRRRDVPGQISDRKSRTAAIAHSDRKSERCQPCAEGAIYANASFWCQHCSEYLCSTCAWYHKSMKMSKYHIVKTLQDKERYGSVKAKVRAFAIPSTQRDSKPAGQQQTNPQTKPVNYHCEPCKQNKKTRDASFLCDTCKEKLCKDCSQCHRSMKVSKTHKLIALQEVLGKQDSNFSLGMKCERHYDEILSLYCKRCRTSCCSICAITVHNNCGKTYKLDTTRTKDAEPTKPSAEKNTKQGLPAGGTITRSVSFDAKSAPKSSAKLASQAIPKKRMLNRKSRINVHPTHKEDWVISLAVLTNGDILLVELYSTVLKMIDSTGELLSTCSFYGDPWSVAVYNDSQAVVTFSDRKQLQLININRTGLHPGKKFQSRHKCLAVCFAKNTIAASCWEGCIHLFNMSGSELYSVDKDHCGNPLFSNPEFIAADSAGTRLYVSDYKRNTVTALNMSPTKIENKPVFVFTDKDLIGPKGVVVDKQGAVYVSGMSSRNIYRIGPSGEIIQIHRRLEDLDYYEAIGLSSAGDKLFVSAYEDDTIIVLTLQKW